MGHEQSGLSSTGPKDMHTLETLSHFNREKIPERVVHALGAGAYGEFEVCNSPMSMNTMIDSQKLTYLSIGYS